ncbi:MAG: hypothetical protein GXP16_09055 [Gammaproteobacteria bacterium]|nr:hypothetical protein [Gammaproteobacteria bacterium]
MTDEKTECPTEHHPEYRRGVLDAIIWLLRNKADINPEAYAEQMAIDLL